MTMLRLVLMAFLLIFSSFFLAQAQSPLAPSDLTFLETFAQDLYHRGEIRQAQKEFERIKRIDPQNAIANEYLTKFTPDMPIETTLTRPSSVIQQTQAIADDIKKLKTEIQTQEQNIEILKTTLRNSLAENESLFTALDRRTKEVLSLREQVYGSPDSPDSYKDLMQGIVIERLPQYPFSTKTFPSVWSEAPHNEVLSFADIQHTETLLHEARTQGVYDPMRIAELQILLDQQRAILADKNEALTLQTHVLQSLNLDLDTINQIISSIDQDTSSSALLLEQQYQKLMDQQHKQTLKEQEIFLTLLADYATLIKRIQELQKEAAESQKQILSFEEQYQKQNDQIEALNQKIVQQTEQINTYQNTLKEQETIIQKQSQELVFTQQQLQEVHQSLITVQSLLGQTDTEIASLQKELDLFRSFVDLEQKQQQITINHLTQVMQITDEQDQNILELKDHIKNVYAQKPPFPTTSFAMTIGSQEDAQKQLIRLNEILRQTEQDLYRSYLLLNEQDETILDLEEQNQILEHRLAHFTPHDAKTGKEASSFVEQNNALIQQFKKESSILHDTLLAKDQEIQSLHQSLLEKNTLIDDLQKTAEKVAQLRQVVDEKEKLIQDNTDLIAKNTDLAQQVASAQETTRQKDVALSLQELSFAEQQQESLAQITQAKQTLKDTRTQLTSLSLELQEKKTALYALEDHLQEQTSSLQDADKKIQKLEDQIASLAFKQKAMQEIAQQKEQDIVFLEKELRLARKEASLQNTKTQLALKEKIASLEKELSQAKKQLEGRIKDVLNLQQETENLKKDLMMAQALMERYRQEKNCVPTQTGDCHFNVQRFDRTIQGGSQPRQKCWPD